MEPEEFGLRMKAAEIASKIMESIGEKLYNFVSDDVKIDDRLTSIFNKLYDAIYQKIKK